MSANYTPTTGTSWPSDIAWCRSGVNGLGAGALQYKASHYGWANMTGGQEVPGSNPGSPTRRVALAT